MFILLRTAGFLLLLALAACQALPRAAFDSQPDPASLAAAGSVADSRLGASVLTLQRPPGVNSFSIVPVSAETGRPLKDVRALDLSSDPAYGFSQDRRFMAFVSRRDGGCPSYCLRVIDLRTWEETGRPIPIEKSMAAWFSIPDFSDTIPLILNHQDNTASDIFLADPSLGRVTAQAGLPAAVYQAVFTPGGGLAVYGLQSGSMGSEPVIYLALLSGSDLSVLWETTLPQLPLWVDVDGDPARARYYEHGAAFTADGSRLYIAAADRPVLLTIDFQDRSVKTARIEPRSTRLLRLLAGNAAPVSAKIINGVQKSSVLSPDGRILYVAGQEFRAVEKENGSFKVERIPLGVQVIDTRDGALLETIESGASGLAVTQDGKSLLLHGWDTEPDGSTLPWTAVYDIASAKETARLEGTLSPSRLLDGSPIWLAARQEVENAPPIALYIPGESRPASRVTSPGIVDWITIP
jgi:hypothetical protein